MRAAVGDADPQDPAAAPIGPEAYVAGRTPQEAGRWRLDLEGELSNTREYVGGAYTWTYIGADDPYTRAFADQLIDIRGLRRFQGGDNRPLVNRGPG
jgi:hypothetical protein